VERHSEASFFFFTSFTHLPLSEEGHPPGVEILVDITAAQFPKGSSIQQLSPLPYIADQQAIFGDRYRGYVPKGL